MNDPRSHRPTTRSDDGYTLVELMVVLVIMGVIGGMVLGGVISAFRSAASTNQRIDAIQEIESAQRRIVQDLRSATALVLEDGADLATDLTIEFRRDGSAESVRYTVIEPDEDSNDPVQLVRQDTGQTLVTILNNDEGTEPLFTYLNARGVEITCADLEGRACLGAARVRITIVRDLPNSNPVRTNTEVSIRNIRFVGG